jgi:2-polyprenyl-3-methyl-5-hydroxy-6-metoxy-1,4-benzoquinol methylase
MEKFNRRFHWNQIYETKELKDVSWFEPKPENSLHFLEQFQVSKQAKIIDIGGGDSFLVDNLLALGYQNITVLDISHVAIEKAKKRLGDNANKVTWIVSDVTEFEPMEKYDFWHDRAAFHFLTKESEITQYLNIANQCLQTHGILVIGTFSEDGPKKCSGIEIKQYTEKTLCEYFETFFDKISCSRLKHKTPFETIQDFVFCSFKKT